MAMLKIIREHSLSKIQLRKAQELPENELYCSFQSVKLEVLLLSLLMVGCAVLDYYLIRNMHHKPTRDLLHS